MDEFFQVTEYNARLLSFATLLVLLVWETAAPFYSFFKAGLSERSPHAVKNFSFGLANALMISIIFVALWDQSSRFAQTYSFGVLNWLSLSAVTKGIIAILLLDLWTYFWHRMNHRIPFLWRFHKVHHSDPEMDVTTAFRFHLGEIFISSILRVILLMAIGAELWHLALYEALMFPVVQFHHANIGLPHSVDRMLRVFIVTPSMHKIHHSDYQPETDSNYTSLLSIWDRMFGSYRMREEFKTLKLGLKGYKSPSQQTMVKLLKSPFSE